MTLHDAGVVAGTVSTVLFVASYLPMLHKAWRTRDLSSYSVGNLAVANIGNAVHTVYVLSLPVGPIWALHGFYLASTVVMLWWWLRYRGNQYRSNQYRSNQYRGNRRPSAATDQSTATLRA